MLCESIPVLKNCCLSFWVHRRQTIPFNVISVAHEHPNIGNEAVFRHVWNHSLQAIGKEITLFRYLCYLGPRTA